MSQLYEPYQLKKSANKQEKLTTKDTSEESSLAIGLLSYFTKMIFESISAEIDYPVYVKGDKIRIDENSLEENRSYPIQYKGKEYFIRRKKDKTQIFEIKD